MRFIKAEVVLFLVMAVIMLSQGLQKVGRLINCPNVKSTGIDVHGTWEPFAIKPNTMYTVNAELTIHEDIEEAIEGGQVRIPERKDPIYVFDEKRVSCKESDVIQALSFVNVTCPLKRNTHRVITNFKQFLPGTEAVFTGNFVVEAYLKNLDGKMLGCWTANVTIAN